MSQGRKLGIVVAHTGEKVASVMYRCSEPLNSSNPFEAPNGESNAWQRQQLIASASRLPSTPYAALISAHSNLLHMDGIVESVQVSRLIPSKEQTHPEASWCVLLWMRTWDTELASHVPLAVVCPLSRNVASSTIEGDEPQAVTLQAFFESKLGDQRIVASGRLRMEETYCAELNSIVTFPSLLLPLDHWKRSIRLLRKQEG